jgi:hypothetical protein
MALGHQHYFHHYNKQDQSTYPSKAHGSMDEGGSFVPKSCASAVHYYRRAADVVGDHIVQHGVHIPKGKKDVRVLAGTLTVSCTYKLCLLVYSSARLLVYSSTRLLVYSSTRLLVYSSTPLLLSSTPLLLYSSTPPLLLLSSPPPLLLPLQTSPCCTWKAATAFKAEGTRSTTVPVQPWSGGRSVRATGAEVCCNARTGARTRWSSITSTKRRAMWGTPKWRACTTKIWRKCTISGCGTLKGMLWSRTDILRPRPKRATLERWACW